MRCAPGSDRLHTGGLKFGERTLPRDRQRRRWLSVARIRKLPWPRRLMSKGLGEPHGSRRGR